MEQTLKNIKLLAESMQNEFNNVSDYIWKSPRLIKHETELEIKKLDWYFPYDPESAKLRWDFQLNKLNRVFPYLIATGNLFCVLSLFEKYLLLIATELEKYTKKTIDSVKGNGTERFFNYFKKLELNLDDIEFYDQVQAAIKIRNCLIHASGFLRWAKQVKELKRLQKSGTYLSKEARNRRKTNCGEFNEVQIVNTDLGEKLQIENEYVFLVSVYLRDFILGLCQSAVLLIHRSNEQ